MTCTAKLSKEDAAEYKSRIEDEYRVNMCVGSFVPLPACSVLLNVEQNCPLPPPLSPRRASSLIAPSTCPGFSTTSPSGW